MQILRAKRLFIIQMDKCLGYRMNCGAREQFHGNHQWKKSHRVLQPRSRHTYSVHYHTKLSSLESQEQDNPSRWYSLLSLVQISANVYYFSWHFPFSHSKGGWGCLDLSLNSSGGGAETHWDLENAGPGLYKTLSAPALSHLCLSLALGVCEKVMVMVLLGQSGFWDASLTLRPKSISDHFNAEEHGGAASPCQPPTNSAPPGVKHPPCNPHQQIRLHLLIAQRRWMMNLTPLF